MANYLIIGGSSGIGYQLAKQLAEASHLVYVTYHNHKPESEVKYIYFQSLDVMNETFNLEFIPEVLDGLIYCPGSILLRPFARINPDDFLADYQLQVVGAIKTIQKVMPNLKNSSHASIVLFSTLAVQTGLSFHSQVSASKGAIEGLTRSLAAEFAPKVRVNAIAPSLTNTPLAAALLNTDAKMEANAQRHPLQRIGQPTDIAHMAEFLLSEKSSWITGQIFHVDGGMSSIK